MGIAVAWDCTNNFLGAKFSGADRHRHRLNKVTQFEVGEMAAARDGKTLATFRGAAEGVILDTPRGTNGFGYDPLFYFPRIKKTFAELSAEEKASYSHRGAAFRAFVDWCKDNAED